MSHEADVSAPALPTVRRGRLFTVVWIYAGVVLGLFVLTYFSIGLLSAVRAYVEGEGLWSKGQKDAIYALTRYTLYAEETDYKTYQAALSVNQGDRQARIELEKPSPDYALAEAGLLQGRNHPDDISSMIFLFRWFRALPEIERAISIWGEADQQIGQLTEVGERIHAEARLGPLTPAQQRRFLQQLDGLNDRLTPLEDNFSYTLGSAARKYTQLILLVMFAAVLLMLTLAYISSRKLLLQFELTQEVLRQGEEQLRTVLQFAPMSILVVRADSGRVLYVNDHVRQQFVLEGMSLESLVLLDFCVNPADRDRLLAALQTEGSVNGLELLLQDTRKLPFWALYSSQRIRYAGQACVMIALLDVDERKRAHDEMSYRAYHDALTGLPNRAMFMDSFKRSLHRLERSGGSGSLLFIDLDHFKAINDSLGHDMGDLLLQQVAQRILGCVREGDLVARLGGDEFVVLVEGQGDARRMAEKVLEVLRPPYQLGESVAQVTASIGVSSFPRDGCALDELLSAADDAMYRAKTSGRDAVQLFVRKS